MSNILLKLIELKVDVKSIKSRIETIVEDITDEEYSRAVLESRLKTALREIDESLRKAE